MAEAIYVGALLVATPALADPNFRRSVVLILEHDDNGTLGVVLNRPSEVTVTQVLPSWGPLVTGPQVLFEGGPVQTDSALALASVTGAAEPLGWRRLHTGTSAVSRLGTVDLDAPPEILAGEITQMRIFAGYAGWSAGQLEAELREGAWYLVDAEPGDTFHSEPRDLWRHVLRRQPGELAFVATCPDDPHMN